MSGQIYIQILILRGLSKQERTEKKTASLFHYMDLILQISFNPESVSLFIC